MTIQVCQDLSTCLNKLALSIATNQSALMGKRYLITGQQLDYVYPPVNWLLVGLQILEKCFSKESLEESQPLNQRKVSTISNKTIILAANLGVQFILGLTELLFVHIFKSSPSYLKMEARSLLLDTQTAQSSMYCIPAYSNPEEAKSGFISFGNKYVPGYASDFNDIVVTAIQFSAGFKMAISLCAIIGVSLLALCSRNLSSRPISLGIYILTGLFNLSLLAISIYQLSTIAKVDAGAQMIKGWNDCKNLTLST